MDASRIWKPLMAEWWTQQPEPKWSPKDSGREERHGTYVNGHPVQKTEQEMEPLRAIMEPLERKMKCKWREKHSVFFKDSACGWTPIEAKMGLQLLTAQCLFTSINKLPLHLFVCDRFMHCHARCVCVANHSLNPILVWICNFCKVLWSLNYKVRRYQNVNIRYVWIPVCSKSVTFSNYMLHRTVHYTLRGLPVSFKTA